jgi:hypothetical protein
MMAIQGMNYGQKCPSNDKDGTKDCLNCPLVIVVIMAPALCVAESSNHFKNDFTGYESQLISEYHAKAWKPPKGLSHSA